MSVNKAECVGITTVESQVKQQLGGNHHLREIEALKKDFKYGENRSDTTVFRSIPPLFPSLTTKTIIDIVQCQSTPEILQRIRNHYYLDK